MKTLVLVVIGSILLCLTSIAHADVFNLGDGLTNLETVVVDDPGDAGAPLVLVFV